MRILVQLALVTSSFRMRHEIFCQMENAVKFHPNFDKEIKETCTWWCWHIYVVAIDGMSSHKLKFFFQTIHLLTQISFALQVPTHVNVDFAT